MLARMSNVASKLRIQPGSTVALLGTPTDLAIELPKGVKLAASGAADVVVLFAAKSKDAKLAGATKRVGDGGILWVAYPKAGQLGTDLNRDKLAELTSKTGWVAVAQVALDDVWSALRIKHDPALKKARAARKTAPKKKTAKKKAR